MSVETERRLAESLAALNRELARRGIQRTFVWLNPGPAICEIRERDKAFLSTLGIQP